MPKINPKDLDNKILQDFHFNEIVFDEDYEGKIPTLDNKAKIKIASSLDDDLILRVAVIGGGCNGFTYSFTIERLTDIEKDDLYISEIPPVVIDPASLKYMPGATIRWVEEFTYSNFAVDNPGAKQGCGCGSSFSYSF